MPLKVQGKEEEGKLLGVQKKHGDLEEGGTNVGKIKAFGFL